MIRHNTESKEAHRHLLLRLVEQSYEGVVVSLGMKKCLASDSSIEHMKHVTSRRESRATWHGVLARNAEGVGSRLRLRLSMWKIVVAIDSRPRCVDYTILQGTTASSSYE